MRVAGGRLLLPGRETMVVPGEDSGTNDAPLDFVITHEYGHHIAHSRSNAPWDALGWGPKYWATYAHVCEGRTSGCCSGRPGQALLRGSGRGVRGVLRAAALSLDALAVHPVLEPDDGALAAIRRDVTHPWSPPPAVTRRGRFDAGGSSVRSFPVSAALDGTVRLALRGPRRSAFDLQVLIDGKLVAASHGQRSHDRLSGSICSAKSVEVRVKRRRGNGKFRLTVNAPS